MPKSTSFTLNSVASGDQMSMWKRVMADASMVAEVNSMPAKTSEEYFLVALPATDTSVRSAMSQEADQVPTGNTG